MLTNIEKTSPRLRSVCCDSGEKLRSTLGTDSETRSDVPIPPRNPAVQGLAEQQLVASKSCVYGCRLHTHDGWDHLKVEA